MSEAERVEREIPAIIKSLIAQCEANVSKFTNLQMSEALCFGETTFAKVTTLTADNAAKDAEIIRLKGEMIELARVSADLATFVRRLCRTCEVSALVDQATDYLKRKNLNGSVLR